VLKWIYKVYNAKNDHNSEHNQDADVWYNCRIPDNRLAKTVMFGTVDGKQSQGQPAK